MTTPTIIGLVLQTVVYVGVITWLLRRGGRLQARYEAAVAQRNDLVPCAMVCLALGHKLSPAPREIKEQANAAVPAWVRESTSTTILDAAMEFPDVMHPRRSH